MADGEYMRLGCAVPRCEAQHKANGYCVRHNMQARRGSLKADSEKCALCSAAIQPGDKTRTYCSAYCKRKHWALRHPERIAELHKRSPKVRRSEVVCTVSFNACDVCGKEWTARRSKAHCSRECELVAGKVRCARRRYCKASKGWPGIVLSRVQQ